MALALTEGGDGASYAPMELEEPPDDEEEGEEEEGDEEEESEEKDIPRSTRGAFRMLMKQARTMGRRPSSTLPTIPSGADVRV